MRRTLALALVIAFMPALAHAEVWSLGVHFGHRSDLEGFAWWLPDGFISTEVTVPDVTEAHGRRRLQTIGVGVALQVAGPLYAVGGGGLAYEQLSLRYPAFDDFTEGLDAGSSWRPHAYVGAGAAWRIATLPRGALTIGIDVRACALGGTPAGPDVYMVPDIARYSLQGAFVFGMLFDGAR